VLRALAAPTLGHLDPQYFAILDETCELLRQVFRTQNPLTFPVGGTGMAGMECIATNLIEPGDEVLVCINGVFGSRMKDAMERCGATVHALEAPWGQIFTLEQIAAALDRQPRAKLVGIVHAETSTGAHQPLAGLAGIDDVLVRRRLLEEYGIEIGAGLGPMAGEGLAHRPDGQWSDDPQRGPRPNCDAGNPLINPNYASDDSPGKTFVFKP
jgi:aspartate aminotransferase-like enzyme